MREGEEDEGEQRVTELSGGDKVRGMSRVGEGRSRKQSGLSGVGKEGEERGLP